MLKIGIVGAGVRGIDCFGDMLVKRSDAKVVALCDPNPVRMKLAAKRLGIEPSLHASCAEMLKKEKLDAVVICSPDWTHEENAVVALEAGVAVLIDKPLATSAKACLRIIKASKKSGKPAMVGFNLRHHPVLKRLKELIDEGALGEVFMIENSESYVGGRTYMQRWNRLRKFSGGLWMHKGTHDFDVFNWLLGFPKPKRVSASASNHAYKPEKLPFVPPAGVQPGPVCRKCPCAKICPDCSPNFSPEWSDEAAELDGYQRDLCIYLSDKDIHDSGIALVEYADGRRASHSECFVGGDNDRRYTVSGDKAVAHVSLEKRSIEIFPRWGGETIRHVLPPPQGSHGGADPALVDAFIAAIKGESKSESQATLEQGLFSAVIGEAAEISSRGGGMVDVDSLLNA